MVLVVGMMVLGMALAFSPPSEATTATALNGSASGSSSATFTTSAASPTTTTTTASTISSGTYDVVAYANITVSCSGCNGGQTGNSQFQGSYTNCDGGEGQISGNGTKAYTVDCGLINSFSIGWTVEKDTTNGTLVVTVTNYDSTTVFERSTSDPYGSITGCWSITAGPTGITTWPCNTLTVPGPSTTVTQTTTTVQPRHFDPTGYTLAGVFAVVALMLGIMYWRKSVPASGPTR